MRGRVHIAATPVIVAQFLPRVLAEFTREHPSVALGISDCAPDELWELVSSGRCDLGIGSPDLRDKALEWDVVAHDRICVICRADDALATRRSVPWSALKERSFITVTRTSGIRRLIDQTIAKLGLALQPSIEVTYLESALALTRAGLAIAVLPSFFLQGSSHADELVARPLVAPTVRRDIMLLRKRGSSLTPAAMRLREMLLENRPASE